MTANTQPLTLVSIDVNPWKNQNDFNVYSLHHYQPARSKAALGRPAKRDRFHVTKIFLVLLSLLCFAVCAIIISPHLRFAFDLGYNNQLVVVGLMLSIQALCLKRLSQRIFLVLEREWGPSYLQNYDAILSNSIFSKNVTLPWRTALSFITLLPLALSIVYKLFQGGIATSHAGMSHQGNIYAMAGIGDNAFGSRIGLTIMGNISNPFLVSTRNDTTAPSMAKFPLMFGANTLMLSNSSTAILDVPSADYLQLIQGQLRPGEVWKLSGQVNATVSIRNNTVDQHRDDDDYWSGGPGTDIPELEKYLDLLNAYNHWTLGVLSWAFDGPKSYTSCLVGFLPSEDDSVDQHAQFRNLSYMVTTTRQHCHGEWEVTANTLQLTNGSCDGIPILLGSDNPDNSTKIQYDLGALAPTHWFMPQLQENLLPFMETIDQPWEYVNRTTSPWKVPTITTLVAAMYWSRLAALTANTQQPEVWQYRVFDTVTKTLPTIQDRAGLYIVLLIQPALALLCLIGNWFFQSTPVGDKFSMTGILAGVDPKTLPLLKGAGYSGSLSERVRLDVDIQPLEKGEDENEAQIVYRVGGKKSRDKSQTIRKAKRLH